MNFQNLKEELMKDELRYKLRAWTAGTDFYDTKDNKSLTLDDVLILLNNAEYNEQTIRRARDQVTEFEARIKEVLIERGRLIDENQILAQRLQEASANCNALRSDLEELDESLGRQRDDEKRSRIYYQSIVYNVCNQLDKLLGDNTVCGTADSPTTHVIERLSKALSPHKYVSLNYHDSVMAEAQKQLVELNNHFKTWVEWAKKVTGFVGASVADEHLRQAIEDIVGPDPHHPPGPMMVWKYNLKELNASNSGNYIVGEFGLPLSAQLLTVQYQGDNPVLWVNLGQDNKHNQKATIYCVGTGWGEVPDNALYLTTIQRDRYVWHLFYTLEKM